MRPIKTILCPTDESPPSKFAFRAARAIASEFGAHLIILEVVPLGVTIYGPTTDAYLKQIEEGLDRFQAIDPAAHVERRVVEGNPAAEILRAAEESNCDLIVMASHGRTGAKRIILGSVAEAVLRRSRCPVLIVKMPETTTESIAPKRATESGSVVGLMA
jgi:nucleotide-binding universal stress UspA family protein